MNRTLITITSILFLLTVFATAQSSTRQQSTSQQLLDSMGLSWSNAISETIAVTGGSAPVLIAEAPQNQSLVVRQVWTENRFISVSIEDVSKGVTLRLFQSTALQTGYNFFSDPQHTGWRGAYVLSPGDKLWAFNSDQQLKNIHWTGFYIP